MRMEEGRVYAFGSCSYGGRELNLGYHHHAAHVVLADAVTEDDEVEHRDEALEGRPSHQLANIIHAHHRNRNINYINDHSSMRPPTTSHVELQQH